MQVPSRVHQQEMTSEQQPSSPQPQDQRVSFQLPPDTTPISSPLSSPLATTFPTATALAAAAAVGDEPNDPSYDSDNEPSPRDCIDCDGVTNETLLEGQIVKSGYLMKKGERIKVNGTLLLLFPFLSSFSPTQTGWL